MKKKIKCAECAYCKCTGRANSQAGRLGRKEYFCIHPKTKELKDKNGLQLFPFVGFGDYNTSESPLTLKTTKRWCPLSDEGEDFIITKEQAIDCLILHNDRVHSFNIWGAGVLAGADMDLEEVIKIMDKVESPDDIIISNQLHHLCHFVAVFNNELSQWYYFDSNTTKVDLLRKDKNRIGE